MVIINHLMNIVLNLQIAKGKIHKATYDFKHIVFLKETDIFLHSIFHFERLLIIISNIKSYMKKK